MRHSDGDFPIAALRGVKTQPKNIAAQNVSFSSVLRTGPSDMKHPVAALRGVKTHLNLDNLHDEGTLTLEIIRKNVQSGSGDGVAGRTTNYPMGRDATE